MKEKVRPLARRLPVRLPVLGVMAAGRAISRLASVLRTAALWPRGPIPICHWSVTVKYASNIKLGAGVVIGPHCTLGALAPIELGDHVRLSEGVMIETAGLDFEGAPPYRHTASGIHIERGVWIGARAIILGGVRIGEGAVIGAGAVVSRSVPAGAVVVGQRPSIRERIGNAGGRGIEGSE